MSLDDRLPGQLPVRMSILNLFLVYHQGLDEASLEAPYLAQLDGGKLSTTCHGADGFGLQLEV